MSISLGFLKVIEEKLNKSRNKMKWTEAKEFACVSYTSDDHRVVYP